jgi:hypothetical protein
MRKIDFLKLIWILFYIAVFCFLLSNSHNYLDPDLGWHLKVGEQIVSEKSVPSYDYYDWTIEGRKWVDHEWLSNVIVYLLYNHLGYLAVNIFFALIILFVLIILNIFTQRCFLKEKNGSLFILFFQILGLIAMSPHLGVRIQELTLLNLFFLFIIIYYYEKNKKAFILFWLLPLFYFWSCLHPGFLIGIFIMFFWIAIKLAEIIVIKCKDVRGEHKTERSPALFLKSAERSGVLPNLENKFNSKNLLTFSYFALLSTLVTFFTPYGLKLFEFLSSYGNTFYMTHIQEWLPSYYFPFQYWQLLYIAFAITVIYLIIYSREKIKLELWEILILSLFVILALKSKRHFPLLFIISFPIMIKFFADFFDWSDGLILEKLKQLPFVKLCLIIVLPIIIIAQLLKTNFTANPFLSFSSDYPHGAVNFLENNPEYDNLNLFNEYGWGGYLIWTLPEKKLFIDGRLPQYPFAGHTFLEEYFEFFDKEKVENKLTQYDIRLILLDIREKKYKLNWFEKYFFWLNEEEINQQENHLKNYLDNSNEWQVVYNDNISRVYVKK